MSDVVLFRVLESRRTRIETIGDVLGWGVRFPSGLCYVDWNRRAFPEDDRLEGPHVSQYATLDDVEQGTGGHVERLFTWRIDVSASEGDGDE
jgi:hypothetical protein